MIFIHRLSDEPARVEDELVKTESMNALLQCFVSAKANSFENLLDPFLKMMRISTPITLAMTKSSEFFKRIIDRLAHNSKAVVRLNLLKILRTVCEVHPNRAMLVEKYGLLGVVESLSQGGGDGAVLVRELARDIVPSLKPGLRPPSETKVKTHKTSESGSGVDSPKTGSAIAPKKMRRAASETSASVITERTSSTARYIGSKVKPRQRLGDISWQNGTASGSGTSKP